MTDDETLEVVKMVFAGKISVEILSALRAHQIHAVGVSGIDGNVVLARRRSKKRVINRETGKRETIDFGNVGDVVDVDPRLLTTLLDAGYLPVVSPLAIDTNTEICVFDGYRSFSSRRVKSAAMPRTSDLIS